MTTSSTIKFSNSVLALFLGRGIIAAVDNPLAMTIFSGSQPSADNITNYWASQNANFLVHWQGVVLSQPEDSLLLTVTGFPNPAIAVKSGTATWGIIWGSNVTQATVQSTTLPSTNFIVVPVSLASQTGVIRLNSQTISVGDTVQLADASMVAF